MTTAASLKLTVRQIYMEGSEGCIVISLVQRCFGTSDLPTILKGYVVTALVFGVVTALVPSLISRVLLEKKRKQLGVPVTVGGEEGYAIRNAQAYDLIECLHKDATTAAALFEQSCKKHSRKLFHGTRKLIERELLTDGDGRKIEKLHLGNYVWQTYGEVFDRACNFASGLIELGHDVSTRAAIFADTRSEWFIAFQGCFRQNITVVTIYSSLGEDALIHSLNETEVSTLICDSQQLRKIISISSSLNTIKNVIYFDDEGNSDADECRSYSNWKVTSFSVVEKLGLENLVPPCLPSKNDTAVIMYTSGSTGLPKGVVITHGNIVASTAAVRISIPNLDSNDVHIAHLPLSHVYELVFEFVVMTAGAQIGYGSPLTLTDNSNKIKKGTKGDVSVLKPTIIATVPAIVDRIRDAVYKKVEQKGGVVKKLFDIGFKRQLAAVEGSWFGAWGLERMFWDNIVFRNINLVFGGRVRFIICSGAPLSADSQRFINICMCAPVAQAYGLTEIFGAATLADGDDTTVRWVGAPLQSCYIKLVPWKDGGYLTTDRPMPRGEIVVGGPSVSSGYFKNQEKTDEVFKVDENGTRWFYTGDIGRFHPDGCLEIIDRKKDIVKLQHGEYVSLGKIEAALISSNYVDRIMVYADPFHTFCIALIVPVRQELEKWAQEAGIKYIDFSELCGRAEAVSEVQQSLVKVGKAEKLVKYEIPGKIYLAPDPWTPESGLVTAALKIKREQIKSKFKSEIERLYA